MSIFLVVALFIGVAAATPATQEELNNLTVNLSVITAATAVCPADLKIINDSTTAFTADVFISLGDESPASASAATAFAADGTTYSSNNTHTYQKAGTYTVTLYNVSTITGAASKKGYNRHRS